MKHRRPKYCAASSLALVLFLIVPGLAAKSAAELPSYAIFREIMAPDSQVDDIEPVAMNDAAQVVGTLTRRHSNGSETHSVFLVDGMQWRELPLPDGADYPRGTAISEPAPDGSFFVTGAANFEDGFSRGIVWSFGPSAAGHPLAATHTLTNVVLPEDSAKPGEQSWATPTGVSPAGTVVGHGVSYIAGVPLYWLPPYNAPAQRAEPLDPGTSGDVIHGIDGSGNMLQSTFMAGIFLSDQLIPGSVPTGIWDPQQWIATSVRGGWATGYFAGSGSERHTWRWTFGMSGAAIIDNHQAASINGSGTVLGRRVDPEHPSVQQTEVIGTSSRELLADLIPSGLRLGDGTLAYWLADTSAFPPVAINNAGLILVRRGRSSFQDADRFVILAPSGYGEAAGSTLSAPAAVSAKPSQALGFRISGLKPGHQLFGAWKGSGTFPPVTMVPGGAETFAPNAGGDHVLQWWAVGPDSVSTFVETSVHVPAPVSVSVGSTTEGYPASAYLSISGSSAEPVSVSYHTEAASAAAGSDFTPVSGTVLLSPDEGSVIKIPVLADGIAEPGETFFFVIDEILGDVHYDGRYRWSVEIYDADGGGGEPVFTPMQAWEMEHFGGLNYALFEGDDDLDGFPVLIEYALGGDPAKAETRGELFAVDAEGSGLRLNFARRPDPDIRYCIQSSSDLDEWEQIAVLVPGASTWEPSSPGVFVTEGPADPAGLIPVQVTDRPYVAGSGSRYLRLLVEER